MFLNARVIIAALLLAALTACAGGAANDATPTLPQTGANTTAPNAALQSVVLGLAPVTAAMPVAADISGTIAFPAISAPATVVLSASTVAPSGVAPQATRTTKSAGTLTVYDYVSMTPATTITLPSIPAMHFTFPAATPIAAKSFYYGISDPNNQGGTISFDTQGPGEISGSSVSFPAVATPLTLPAGHKFTFVLYATTSTSGKIFVANEGNNTITSYTASGAQTTPTIQAGISAPSAVAVDATGKIYVLNSGSSTITTYNADGSQTTPTISVGLAGPTALGVDSTGKIYVLNHDNYVVTTYLPDGSQTTPTITGLNQPSGMAVDASGKVYITNYGYRTFDSGVTTYNPDGSLGTPHIIANFLQPQYIAVGATGKLYVDFEFPGILVTYNQDGTTAAPTIGAGVPYAFTVDPAGKIYGTNPITNTVTTFDSNGLPTTPTITTGLNKPSGIAVH